MPEEPGELAALRARAYGPHADITADPEALRRLTILEEGARRARTAPPAPPIVDAIPDAVAAASASRAASAPQSRPEALTRAPVEIAPDGVAALESAVAAASDTAPPRRRWSTAALATAVAGAAVLGAAVAVPATLILAPTGPQPVAVLHVDANADVGEMFAEAGGGDAVRYDDFYGMEVTGGSYQETGGRCLMIVFDPGGAPGSATGNCAAEGLEPWIDVPVDGQLSGEVQARYQAGSTLRFALSGDEVHVFVSRGGGA